MEKSEAPAASTCLADIFIANKDLARLKSIAEHIKSYLKTLPTHKGDGESQSNDVTIESLMATDPSLDPSHDGFDIQKWIKAVLAAATRKEVRFRRASFAFQNLTVQGLRPTEQIKENVLSSIFPQAAVSWIGGNGCSNKREILKDCHGVVNSGEILMVLGRTGSGVSTFLKTVAGEMHGLKLVEGSILHCNGKFSNQ
jgi:ATP-binding cassette, subfamily G (WHITE), member 2, PDR